MAGRGGSRLDVAYLNYGEQGGVTAGVTAALLERGHRVRRVCAVGALEPRDPRTGNRRVSISVLAHLAAAAARYRRRAVAHRWNTPYAFDAHSERARLLLGGLQPPPRVVLQNGALFAPGIPPPFPYVLLVDNTRALAMEAGPVPGLPPPTEYGPAWRAREAAVYAGARDICACSRRAAESLTRHYGIPAARVHVVGAGASVFPARAARVDDGRTILFLGEDFRRKGGPVLLEAFRIVRRRHPKARLLVAGPKEPMTLPRGSVHLGPVSSCELPDLLALATAFALPTLGEPSGLAFLDAMACGVPCIGTRTDAVPEIVEDGVDGWLVPPGDPVALAAAISAVIAEPRRAAAFGAAGRQKVATAFRWSHVAARLEPVLAAAQGTAVEAAA